MRFPSLQVEWAVELGKQLMYTTLEEIESGAGEYDYNVLGWCLAQMVWYGRCVVPRTARRTLCQRWSGSSCPSPNRIQCWMILVGVSAGVCTCVLIDVHVLAVTHAARTGLPSCAWSWSGSSGPKRKNCCYTTMHYTYACLFQPTQGRLGCEAVRGAGAAGAGLVRRGRAAGQRGGVGRPQLLHHN